MQISMRNLFHNYFFKSILTSYTEVVPGRNVRDFFFSNFFPILSICQKKILTLKTNEKNNK